MPQNHELLLGQSQKLIEDFTCPVSGLPTPDRETSRITRLVSPLAQCFRSIWGVSDNGDALHITQGYNVGGLKRVGDPELVLHRELHVELYEGEARFPVSIRHVYASGSGAPQYQGYDVEAYEPKDMWLSTLQKTDDIQGISRRALNTLTEHRLAWFVPVDVQADLESAEPPVAFMPVQDGGPEGLDLASVNGDTRILIAPYDFPPDFTAALFAPSPDHRPTAPGPRLSADHVRAMEATISEHAMALYGLMHQMGAIDISKM